MMETDVAVDHNDRTRRGTLMNIQADIKDFLKVDYDQVDWEIIAELASTAQTINMLLHPESRDD
jgi:hypothetical protein